MQNQQSKYKLVQDLMTNKITTVPTDSTAYEAAEQMRSLNLGFLPVVDHHGRIAGILTDRDLAIRAVTRNTLPVDLAVAIIMSPNPVCCSEDATLDEALKLMQDRHVRRIVVIDEEQRPTGILSLADLAMQHAPSTLQIYTRIVKKVRAEQNACWQ